MVNIKTKLYMGDSWYLMSYFTIKIIAVKKMYEYQRKFHLSCIID